ncbi:MAG: endonuclease III [Nanoarchaeota archaeon]|nr:endonuclease III [Nanoarchaeota archaeon]MBU1854743.1 endonuclease III [Nanoarchaeota archaeon]
MKEVDVGSIYDILRKESKNWKVPVVDMIEIQTNNPFKVLLGTILSARTKDEVTVQASKRLFSKVDKVNDLNKLSTKEIEKLIYPVGFYKTKAVHLKKLPVVLNERFGGVIPDIVEELVELPGVGRKTANLVVAVGFHKPAVCVDTHVHRIMNRFGYIKTISPFESEMALRKKLPVKYWEKINSLLVAFGQHLCSPINPWCSKCPVINYCNQVGVGKKR